MTHELEEAPIVERGLEAVHLAARASSSALHVHGDDGVLELAAAAGAWEDEHHCAGPPLVPGGGPQVERQGGRELVRFRLHAQGYDIGVVTVLRPADAPFESEELELLVLLVDQLAIAVQNARDYREKVEQALRDPLTGVYNRRFFYEALEKEVQRAARYGSSASLVLFDVDDFKQVNDRFGHQTGDDVLRRVASIVGGLVRPADSFARLGGEEFGLLLPETTQLDALLAAERLRTALGRERILEDRKVTISGGISSCPQDASTAEELEGKADAALYWAKRNGKNICALASEVVLTDREQDGDATVTHLQALVTMIDAQSLGTRDHSENVAAYAVALGRALGLDRRRIGRLRQAAFFHDLGKVAVESSILAKRSALAEEELAQVRLHPTIGSTMLLHAGLVEEARWVRHHHERIDGTGYPDGLSGDQIPLESQIILVAEAFEALTSDRSYRRSRPAEEAIAELRRCAGTQFAGDVVEALADLVERDELSVLALRERA